MCCYHPLNHSTPSELHTATSCDLDYILHYKTNRNDAIVAGHFNSFNANFLERDFGLKQMVTAATHCSKTIDKSLLSQSSLSACDAMKSIVKVKHLAVIRCSILLLLLGLLSSVSR